MAAAIVPIITNLLPLVVPYLVKGVEALFGAKTGDTKMQTVIAALKAILEPLATAGKIPGVPSNDALQALIETIVQDLKSKNELPAPIPNPAPPVSQMGSTLPVGLQQVGGKIIAILVQQP